MKINKRIIFLAIFFLAIFNLGLRVYINCLKNLDRIKNFDLEAFVYYQGNLYLFNKNRREPFDGYTNLYKMCDYASNQNEKFIVKFKSCE